ncbi:serine hydrolase domain-containing protein [Stella sp.]|uniref:serine hydrolase domain-containing protein n=1 Tax=Stella sp. TaxID=2912054 RepID=UPI0035B40ACD
MRPLVGLAALALGAGLAFPALAADPPLPPAVPEAVGMSGERLGRIAAVLQADIAAGRIPGAVVAVARRGRLAYYEAFGFRDKEAGVAMTKDTIFAIASMTKPMTSVAMMMLNEEGRLFVSDPIGRYHPALAKMPVAILRTGADGQPAFDTEPAKRAMTLQDLLRHTSGLTYGGRGSTAVHKIYPASSGFSGTNLTSAEFVEKLASVPLLYQPGTRWEYGLSTDVVGTVVEKVSGQSLGAFLQERLWTPLGMADTSFTIPAGKHDRFARALPNDPDTGRPQTVLDLRKPLKMECGGGCAASTAGDYIRFAQMLLDRGQFQGRRLLAPKTVDFMTADHMGAADRQSLAPGYGFGLGFTVRLETGVAGVTGSPGDYNWGGAYGTWFWIDPREQMTTVFMAHAPGPTRLHYRRLLTTLVNQAIVD